MSSRAHRIQRLCWLVRAPSTAAAFSQRQQLRNELDTVLGPAFERVFDAFAPGGEVLRIPRLTLQLQLGAGPHTAAELASLIEHSLPAALSAAAGAAPAQPGVQRLSAAEHHRALLVEYLASGRIGWEAGTPDTGSLLAWLTAEAEQLAAGQQAVEDVITGTLDARLAKSFRLLQLLSPSTREALLQQRAAGHNGQPLAALRQLAGSQALGGFLQLRVAALLLAWRDEDLSATKAESVAQLLAACSQRLSHGSPRDAALVQAVGAALGRPVPHAGTRGGPPEVPGAADETTGKRHSPAVPGVRVGESPPDDGARREAASGLAVAGPPPAPADATPGGPSFPVVPGTRDGGWRPDDAARRVSPPEPALGRPLPAPADGAAGERPSSAGPGSRGDHPLPDDVAWRVRPPEPAAAAQGPGLLAGDAGLILLHPFLPRLFDATGLAAADSRSLPAAAWPRAAALLHWLATGREEVFEFELSLSKVLLGLTPQDPLPVGEGLLNDGARAEADALLVAAIQHWTALRNTSVAGLRASFLQRRGLLRDGEHGWRLQVEVESFDMLVGQLPWGLGIVKLPWMTKPIYTDWPTP